jgi:hypothetical protein
MYMLSGEGSGFDSQFLHNTSSQSGELIFCSFDVHQDIESGPVDQGGVERSYQAGGLSFGSVDLFR